MAILRPTEKCALIRNYKNETLNISNWDSSRENGPGPRSVYGPCRSVDCVWTVYLISLISIYIRSNVNVARDRIQFVAKISSASKNIENCKYRRLYNEQYTI